MSQFLKAYVEKENATYKAEVLDKYDALNSTEDKKDYYLEVFQDFQGKVTPEAQQKLGSTPKKGAL